MDSYQITRAMEELYKRLNNLLSHQRANRGDDNILHDTCKSILSIYEEHSDKLKGSPQELESLASCMCSKGVIDLIESALSLYEDYPSMERGAETQSLCLTILSLLSETDTGCNAIRDKELTTSSCVRWMILKKYGESIFGAGLLERMQKHIPSEEDMIRLCSI